MDEKFFKTRDVHYIPFHFALGDKEYPDDLGATVSYHDFYNAMAQGIMTKTSQVSAGEYVTYFTPFLEAGKDILHICLSSGLSGTYNSALAAESMLQEKFPNRKIYIVDSLGASSGYGLLMDRLADMRDTGMPLDELRAYAEEHKLNVHHWFFSTDLKYYVRGGRISKASGFLGNVFHICPLLNVDDLGHLVPREKIRTVKRVEEVIVDKMEQCCDKGLDYDEKVFLSASDCMEYATAVASLVENRFHKMKGTVQIYSVGTTIGAHTGPGTVALFFFGKKRSN
jgi:DegV family protein with EDD domain